jgi:hypothetical protein
MYSDSCGEKTPLGNVPLSSMSKMSESAGLKEGVNLIVVCIINRIFEGRKLVKIFFADGTILLFSRPIS